MKDYTKIDKIIIAAIKNFILSMIVFLVLYGIFYIARNVSPFLGGVFFLAAFSILYAWLSEG